MTKQSRPRPGSATLTEAAILANPDLVAKIKQAASEVEGDPMTPEQFIEWLKQFRKPSATTST